MDEKIILEMKFKDLHPVSTNDMYIPIAGRKVEGRSHRRAFLHASPQLQEYKEVLFMEMTEFYSVEISEFLMKSKKKFGSHLGFKLNLLFRMPDMYYKQKSKSDDLRPYDVSNYIKSTEDALATRLLLDDKYNMEVKSVKICDKSIESGWGLDVTVEAVDYTYYNCENFDKIND